MRIKKPIQNFSALDRETQRDLLFHFHVPYQRRQQIVIIARCGLGDEGVDKRLGITAFAHSGPAAAQYNRSCLVELPLFQTASCEVVVSAPDLRAVGFDGLPVVLPLGFFVLAVHAQDILVVHALNPAAVQRLSAPIAILNFRKSVSHTHFPFPIITCISILYIIKRGIAPALALISEVVVVEISAGVAQGAELLEGGFPLPAFGHLEKVDVIAFDQCVRGVALAFDPLGFAARHRKRQSDHLGSESPDAVLIAGDRECRCSILDHWLSRVELLIQIRTMAHKAARDHLRFDSFLNFDRHRGSFGFVDLGDQVAFDVRVDSLVNVLAHFLHLLDVVCFILLCFSVT